MVQDATLLPQWPGDVMVRALDLQLEGHGFDSWLFRYQRLLGKLFTRVPLVTKQHKSVPIKGSNALQTGR